MIICLAHRPPPPPLPPCFSSYSLGRDVFSINITLVVSQQRSPPPPIPQVIQESPQPASSNAIRQSTRATSERTFLLQCNSANSNRFPYAFSTNYDSPVFTFEKHDTDILHPPSRPGGHITQPSEAGKSFRAVQQVASALTCDFPGHRTRTPLWHLSRKGRGRESLRKTSHNAEMSISPSLLRLRICRPCLAHTPWHRRISVQRAITVCGWFIWKPKIRFKR